VEHLPEPPTTWLDDQGLPCICSSLRRASRVATRRYDEALRPSGLTITQFDLLATLARVQPLAVKDLAAVLTMDRTTLSRDLDPLERDGLVELTVGRDRRSRLVQLTEHGLKVFSQAAPMWRAVQDELERQLGPKEVASLLNKLEGVVDIVQDH
jgi:DNA-binding MarR family transcriptional regulator